MQRLRALQRGVRGFYDRSQNSASENFGIFKLDVRVYSAQPAPEKGDTIELTVDGKTVSVPKGYNLLQACEAGGVDIPRYE